MIRLGGVLFRCFVAKDSDYSDKYRILFRPTAVIQFAKESRILCSALILNQDLERTRGLTARLSAYHRKHRR